MPIRLIIIEGPRRGDEIVVDKPLVLGRKSANINLQDSKASSAHAKIYEDDQGHFILEDLGSSNGTLLNQEKVSVSEVKIGDIITIGGTKLAVNEPFIPPPETKSWQQVLSEALEQMTLEPPTGFKDQVGPFASPVVLEIEKGLQAGERYTFGFGPRKLGRYCGEGFIIDPDATPEAFELFPSPTGLCDLKTSDPQLKVNGQSLKNNSGKFGVSLAIGDRISFGQTVIVVKALEPGL